MDITEKLNNYLKSDRGNQQDFDDLVYNIKDWIKGDTKEEDKRIKCIYCKKPILIDKFAGVNKEGIFCNGFFCLMELSKKLDKEEDKRNPAHFCLGCDKFLGFRGFCARKCHDKWYNDEFFSFGKESLKKEEEEDNWNLADKDKGLSCSAFTIDDIKTFIQKVKEDMNRLSEQHKEMSCKHCDIFFIDLKEIIDKRAGRL